MEFKHISAPDRPLAESTVLPIRFQMYGLILYVCLRESSRDRKIYLKKRFKDNSKINRKTSEFSREISADQETLELLTSNFKKTFQLNLQ